MAVVTRFLHFRCGVFRRKSTLTLSFVESSDGNLSHIHLEYLEDTLQSQRKPFSLDSAKIRWAVPKIVLTWIDQEWMTTALEGCKSNLPTVCYVSFTISCESSKICGCDDLNHVTRRCIHLPATNHGVHSRVISRGLCRSSFNLCTNEYI